MDEVSLTPDRPWALAAAIGFGLIAVYPWLIYPAVLRAVTWRVRRGEHGDPEEWPSITVLVAARNEEAHIVARVENILAKDYPRDCLSIVCVSDASDDGTDELFREAARPLGDRARLVRQPVQLGKSAALQVGWREVQSDVVVLTDANAHFEPGTLRALARPFSDPRVGAVAGVKRIRVPEEASTHEAGEGAYWHFESRLRVDESRLGLCQSADGACWAVRRTLWDGSGPRGRFADDLWGALEVQRQGYRVEATLDAVASEDAAASLSAEVQRKRRTQYGLLLLLPHLGWMFMPSRWRSLWCFVSHKVLRLATPWALVGHDVALAAADEVWSVVAVVEALVATGLMVVAASGTATSRPMRGLAGAGYFLIALIGPAVACLDAVWAMVRRDPGASAWQPGAHR